MATVEEDLSASRLLLESLWADDAQDNDISVPEPMGIQAGSLRMHALHVYCCMALHQP